MSQGQKVDYKKSLLTFDRLQPPHAYILTLTDARKARKHNNIMLPTYKKCYIAKMII